MSETNGCNINLNDATDLLDDICSIVDMPTTDTWKIGNIIHQLKRAGYSIDSMRCPKCNHGEPDTIDDYKYQCTECGNVWSI